MKLDLPEAMRSDATLKVFAALETKGGKDCVRFVGGSVRNLVMGRTVSDFDLATQLTPYEVEAAMAAADIKNIPTGKAFGTITAIAGATPFEITSLRRDVETDGRRAVVRYTTDWAEDAHRRDFYLNALYADIHGHVFDPTGLGLADAKAGVVRFIGEPEQRIREDYLRILRFFRFTAIYGQGVDEASLEACVALKNGMDGLSGERILQELTRMLALPEPAAIFHLMLRHGVLDHIFGPVDSGLGLPVFEAMITLSADTDLRLAALLYDLDRLHNDHLDTISARLKLPNRRRDRLKTVTSIVDDLDLTSDDQTWKTLLYSHGREAVVDWVCLMAATQQIPKPAFSALSQRINGLGIPVFPLTGKALMAMGFEAGPELGEALKAVEVRWVAQNFSQSVIDQSLDEWRKRTKL